MNYIELVAIQKTRNTLCYDFRYSEALAPYFTGREFTLTYPEDIEQVPDAVLSIPFAANTLQISWLADCELIIPQLDRDFYESIPNFLEGFKNMYPEANFAGKLTIGEIVDCKPEKQGAAASFFSGGVDATTTLLRHVEERPHLISIWGSDVDYDNEAGWAVVEKGLRETAKQYDLPLAVIRSRFREFDDVVKLTEDFRGILQTSWWYGVKHGLGLIGHAAPYAWLHGVNVVYIASSNCIDDGKVRCASDPSIDSNVAFCRSKVWHDAFEMDRMTKINYIVDYHRKNPEIPIKVHVCWSSDTGENCCSCEKCCRTMIGFLIAGEDPQKFGFLHGEDAIDRIYQYIALRYENLSAYTSWQFMQKDLRKKWDSLSHLPYRDKLEWMLDFDFAHPEENECRKKYRKTWVWKSRIVKTFPRLYKLYIKIRGYSFAE